MRKLCIALCLLPSLLWAQVFKSVSMEKLDAESVQDARIAGISGDGRYVFTTSWSNKGLVRLDLDTKEACPVTDAAGAGLSPVISNDGTLVLHTTDIEDEQHLHHTALQMVNLHDNTSLQLMSPTREAFGYALRGKQAVAIAEGKQALHALPAKVKGVAEESKPILVNQDLRMTITVEGETRSLAPNGDDEDTNYIWASLSPNGKQVLYYVSGEGAYVCDLEGEQVQFIAHDCFAPQWYDDQTIVAFHSTDDGQFIKSSALMAFSLEGKRQQLTDPSFMLMYPYCSAEGGRIVSSSPSGEIYVLNISK